MHTKCLLLVALILLVVAPRAWTEELPWEKKLPFKEATIHYEITGNELGTETLYIKEHGQRQAKHHSSTVAIMGTTKKTETIEIIDPEWIYTFDLVEKKAAKTTNPSKLYAAEYTKLTAEEKKNFARNAKELGAGMMGQYGGSVKRKAGKILGFDCDITTVGGMSTVHLLHDTAIPLRAETSVMGVHTLHAATKIDTGSAVPASAFVPPAGLVAQLDQETESMMAGMIQHTVATLKQPDGARQMQQAGPMGMMGGSGMQQQMQKEMQAEGMSPQEQQDMMRQMNEAMQQMQKMQQPKK